MSADLTHAGGVVVRDAGAGREYLIVRSSRGSDWVLPKGHIEKGERAEEAAVREVREEAAVEAEIIRDLGTIEYRVGADRVRAKFFAMRFQREMGSTEQRSPRWVSAREAQLLLAHEDAKRLVEETDELLGGAP